MKRAKAAQRALTDPLAEDERAEELRQATVSQAVDDLLGQVAYWQTLCGLERELAPVRSALEALVPARH